MPGTNFEVIEGNLYRRGAEMLVGDVAMTGQQLETSMPEEIKSFYDLALFRCGDMAVQLSGARLSELDVSDNVREITEDVDAWCLHQVAVVGRDGIHVTGIDERGDGGFIIPTSTIRKFTFSEVRTPFELVQAAFRIKTPDHTGAMDIGRWLIRNSDSAYDIPCERGPAKREQAAELLRHRYNIDPADAISGHGPIAAWHRARSLVS